MQSSRIQKRFVALGSVLVLALFIFTLAAQTLEPSKPAQTQDAPKAVFKQTVHDFGDVNRGDSLSYTFVVKNEGKGPLNILSVNPG